MCHIKPEDKKRLLRSKEEVWMQNRRKEKEEEWGSIDKVEDRA